MHPFNLKSTAKADTRIRVRSLGRSATEMVCFLVIDLAVKGTVFACARRDIAKSNTSSHNIIRRRASGQKCRRHHGLPETESRALHTSTMMTRDLVTREAGAVCRYTGLHHTRFQYCAIVLHAGWPAVAPYALQYWPPVVPCAISTPACRSTNAAR
eukprot:1370803-Rhodomonas_salina.1